MPAMDWLGPTLGLVGTAFATGVGLYQWRKADKQRRTARFATRRAEVMEALLQQLQQLQLASRTRTIDEAEMEKQAQGLNGFLIENRLWLETSEGDLAREYMQVLHEIYRVIKEGPSLDFKFIIGTEPSGVYSDSVAHLFVRLGQVEKALVQRTRKAMRI